MEKFAAATSTADMDVFAGSLSTTANPILFGHNKAASQTYSAATLFNNTSNTKG